MDTCSPRSPGTATTDATMIDMQLEIKALRADQETMHQSWRRRKDQIHRMEVELHRLRSKLARVEAELAAKVPGSYDPRGPRPHFSTPAHTPTASNWRSGCRLTDDE